MYKEVEAIEFPSLVARMAGDFFEVNGVFYHPAQVCNVEYRLGTAENIKADNEIDWSYVDKALLKKEKNLLTI